MPKTRSGFLTYARACRDEPVTRARDAAYIRHSSSGINTVVSGVPLQHESDPYRSRSFHGIPRPSCGERGIRHNRESFDVGDSIMSLNSKLALLLIVSLLLPDCGGGGSPTVSGLKVATFPSNATGYVNETPPWNQVSFTAYYVYSDNSVGTTPVAGVQWTSDPQAYWVWLQGNVATCAAASPSRAIVTGTANWNGAAVIGTSGMWCMYLT
jgi:hypothetical protein